MNENKGLLTILYISLLYIERYLGEPLRSSSRGLSLSWAPSSTCPPDSLANCFCPCRGTYPETLLSIPRPSFIKRRPKRSLALRIPPKRFPQKPSPGAFATIFLLKSVSSFYHASRMKALAKEFKMYRRLFYLSPISNLLVCQLLDGSYRADWDWKEFQELIHSKISRNVTAKMISMCLRALCPHGSEPWKYQQGKDRRYFLALPSRDKMLEHFRTNGPPHVKEMLRDTTQ